MAISPASDLILDVARAADPQKAMATTKVLVAASGDVPGEFATALDRLPTSAAVPSVLSYKTPAASVTAKETPAPWTHEASARPEQS